LANLYLLVWSERVKVLNRRKKIYQFPLFLGYWSCAQTHDTSSFRTLLRFPLWPAVSTAVCMAQACQRFTMCSSNKQNV